MRSEFVRIYTEEELRCKVRQTETLLRQIKEQVYDFYFCDIPALKDMWILYESTRYIVSESMLLEERYDKEDLESLFIERQVENDYSDDLLDLDSLHNSLVSLQFLYKSIQGFLSSGAYHIRPAQYEDPHRLVEEIAADIYLRLNPYETNEYPKVVAILEYLNYTYIYPSGNDFVELFDVVQRAYNKEQENNKVLKKLIDTLDLQFA